MFYCVASMIIQLFSWFCYSMALTSFIVDTYIGHVFTKSQNVLCTLYSLVWLTIEKAKTTTTPGVTQQS